MVYAGGIVDASEGTDPIVQANQIVSHTTTTIDGVEKEQIIITFKETENINGIEYKFVGALTDAEKGSIDTSYIKLTNKLQYSYGIMLSSSSVIQYINNSDGFYGTYNSATYKITITIDDTNAERINGNRYYGVYIPVVSTTIKTQNPATREADLIVDGQTYETSEITITTIYGSKHNISLDIKTDAYGNKYEFNSWVVDANRVLSDSNQADSKPYDKVFAVATRANATITATFLQQSKVKFSLTPDSSTSYEVFDGTNLLCTGNQTETIEIVNGKTLTFKVLQPEEGYEFLYFTRNGVEITKLSKLKYLETYFFKSSGVMLFNDFGLPKISKMLVCCSPLSAHKRFSKA